MFVGLFVLVLLVVGFACDWLLVFRVDVLVELLVGLVNSVAIVFVLFYWNCVNVCDQFFACICSLFWVFGLVCFVWFCLGVLFDDFVVCLIVVFGLASDLGLWLMFKLLAWFVFAFGFSVVGVLDAPVFGGLGLVRGGVCWLWVGAWVGVVVAVLCGCVLLVYFDWF